MWRRGQLERGIVIRVSQASKASPPWRTEVPGRDEDAALVPRMPRQDPRQRYGADGFSSTAWVKAARRRENKWDGSKPGRKGCLRLLSADRRYQQHRPHPDQVTSGALQLLPSLNCALLVSFPQIFFPARLGLFLKYRFLSSKCRSIAATHASTDS